MGMLTNFVVAKRSEAQRVCDSDSPGKEFVGVEAKGIAPVMLGTLQAILTETEFDESTIEAEPLAAGGEDGPWVTEVSPALVKQLAKLDAKGVAAAAAKWAKTEEFASAGRKPSAKAVQELLADLAQLSSKAVAAKKSVLMWMSL